MDDMSLVEIVRIALALMVPWLAGLLWVALALPADSKGRRASAIGFGFPVGMVIVIVTILGQGALGWQHQFGLTLLVTGIAGLMPLIWLLIKKGQSELVAPGRTVPGLSVLSLPRAERLLATALLVLILFKLLLIAQEVWLRPLFPWDAWNFHSLQARIWAEHGLTVELVRSWWAGLAGNADTFYVQFAVHLHPPGLSIVQFWMVEALTDYDDALLSLPWAALAISLCLAMYGQVRMHGGSRIGAIAAAYLLISLPVVHTHLALGGYADIWMAVYFLMAASALCAWLSKPSFGTVSLCLLGLGGMLVMKQSGLFWLPVVLAGLFFGLVGLRWGIGIFMIGLGILLGIQFGLDFDLVGQFTSRRLAEVPQEASRVATHLARNLLLDANWHLLWYLVPFALVFALGLRATRTRPLLSLTMTIIIGLAALMYAFFFTRAGDWVISGTTVNRVLLHLVPVIVLWLALIAEEVVRRLQVMLGGRSLQ